MATRTLTALAVISVATFAGCGGDSAPADRETVTLSISKDFGTEKLSPRQQSQLSDGRTAMRQLKLDHEVGTYFDGRVVQSIDGVSQARERAQNETAWIFYVNGFDSDLLPSDFKLHAGDVVHWDLREWDAAMSVRANVGAFPETFTRGMYGKRFPVTVECDRPASDACRDVKGALRRVGVTPDGSHSRAAEAPPGELRRGRIFVGRWTRWRERPLLRHIDPGPPSSSVFARFSRDAKTIDLLDWDGRRVKTVGAGSGLVAATLPVDEDLIWLVTGVDDEGVDRAARAFNSRDLRDAFAVVATRDGLERVPRPPPPKEPDGASTDPNAGARYGVEGTPPSPSSERREAEIYAPLVMVDGSEPWRPTGVVPLLQHSVLWWAHGPRCASEKVAVGFELEGQWTRVYDWLYKRSLGRGPAYWRLPSDRDCAMIHGARAYANEVTRPHKRAYRPPSLPLTDGFYLDLDQRWLRRIRGEVGAAPAPAYVERRREQADRDATVRLSYWMLFPVHDPSGTTTGVGHEGDWERVDVLLNGRKNGKPLVLALYDADGTRRELPWSEIATAPGSDGQRPTLSAARGTHAMSVRGCRACRRWPTWESVAIARNQPWYGYGGAWGAAGRTSATTGPLGPRGLPLLPPREYITGRAGPGGR